MHFVDSQLYNCIGQCQPFLVVSLLLAAAGLQEHSQNLCLRPAAALVAEEPVKMLSVDFG